MQQLINKNVCFLYQVQAYNICICKVELFIQTSIHSHVQYQKIIRYVCVHQYGHAMMIVQTKMLASVFKVKVEALITNTLSTTVPYLTQTNYPMFHLEITITLRTQRCTNHMSRRISKYLSKCQKSQTSFDPSQLSIPSPTKWTMLIVDILSLSSFKQRVTFLVLKMMYWCSQ